MSFDFRGIRIQSNDPQTQFVVELQKKLAKFLTENQILGVDSENEDIYSDAQDMETAVKYHSELSGQHQFNFDKDYYPPFEPDGNQVKCWIRGTNLGNSIRDVSGFNNNASLFGDPTLVDGTIDLGTQTSGVKSIALRLNRPTSGFENEEWLQIADTAGLQLASAATGFSVFMRIRPFSIAEQGGKSATLFEKIDDSTPSNGTMLQIRNNGRLLFVVKKGGVTTAKETAIDTIAVDTIYDIFVTFTVAGSVAKVYVNGVDKSTTDFGGTVNWHNSLTNHDFCIFRRGLGLEEGFVYGDFYDFKPYYNRIVTQTEVTRHQTNKWSISDIGFGQVMITNHWGTKWTGGAPPGGLSFTTTSFTPTSFTA